MTDKDIAFLQDIADETRWKILSLLMDKERCVCEIFPAVKRTQSTVSIHLAKLERSGIVQSERQGHKMFYKITDERVRKVYFALQIRKTKAPRAKSERARRTT